MSANSIVKPSDLPAARDKHGHLVGYPGQLVYVSGNRRLIYVGTLDGRHDFLIEEVTRVSLGQISLAAAIQEVDHLNKGAKTVNETAKQQWDEINSKRCMACGEFHQTGNLPCSKMIPMSNKP